MFQLLFLYNFAKTNEKVKTPTPKPIQKTKDAQWLFLEKIAKGVMENNGRVLSSKSMIDYEKARRSQATAKFMPELDLDAGVGYRGEKTKEDNSLGATKPETSNGSQDASLTLRQNLFRGMKDLQTNKERNEDVKKQQHEFVSQFVDYLTKTIDDAANAELFWTRIKIGNASVKNRKELVRITKSQVRNEAMPAYEGEKSQAELSQTESELMTDQQRLEEFRSGFKERSGHEVFEFETLPVALSLPKNFDAAMKELATNNYKIKSAQRALQAAEHAKEASYAHLMPEINVEGKVGIDRTFDGYQKNAAGFPGDFDSKVAKKTNAQVRLGLRQNLFKGGENMAVTKEKLALLSRARYELQAAAQDQREKFKSAWERYQRALTNQDNLKKAVAGFESAYNGTYVRYQNGEGKLREVYQEEDKLNSAKKQLAENKKDLIIASWTITLLLGRVNSETFGFAITPIESH